MVKSISVHLFPEDWHRQSQRKAQMLAHILQKGKTAEEAAHTPEIFREPLQRPLQMTVRNINISQGQCKWHGTQWNEGGLNRPGCFKYQDSWYKPRKFFFSLFKLTDKNQTVVIRAGPKPSATADFFFLKQTSCWVCRTNITQTLRQLETTTLKLLEEPEDGRTLLKRKFIQEVQIYKWHL